MDGQFELDESRGTIEALQLDTVSGCAAIKSGRGRRCNTQRHGVPCCFPAICRCSRAGCHAVSQ